MASAPRKTQALTLHQHYTASAIVFPCTGGEVPGTIDFYVTYTTGSTVLILGTGRYTFTSTDGLWHSVGTLTELNVEPATGGFHALTKGTAVLFYRGKLVETDSVVINGIQTPAGTLHFTSGAEHCASSSR